MKAMRVRVFVLLLCVLGFASLASAQGMFFGQNFTPSAGFSVVQAVHCGGAVATTCVTPSMTVTAGHALLAFGSGCTGSNCNSSNAVTTIAMSDSNGGNTWEMPAAAFTQQTGTGGYSGQGAFVCNAVAGTYTFTITINGANADKATLSVAEISGASTSGPTGCIDSSVTNVANNAASANPSIASAGNVSQTGEFIYNGISDSSTPTAVQTEIDSKNNSPVMFDTQGTTGPSSGSSQTMSWTASSGRWVSAILGLKHP